LKFLEEVWTRRACVGANQQELTTCAKSGGQEKKINKNGDSPTRPGIGPRAAGDLGSPPGPIRLFPFFEFFFFRSLGNGPGLLEEWM
jgi:hypothetical protein